MKKNFFRFGGGMSIFVTVIVMLMLFMGFNLYMLKNNYVSFNIPIFQGQTEVGQGETQEPTNPETQEPQPVVVPPTTNENSAVTGVFNHYEGKRTGTEVKQMLTDAVSFNASHDTGIKVHISANIRTEEEASEYLAEVMLLDKEGLKSQEEYYAIQSELNYKVFVAKGTDGIATDIYIIKLG